MPFAFLATRAHCWLMVILLSTRTPGAGITQTSSLVLKEDDKATLTCSQNDNHNFMYWYVQQPGKGLQLIYYSLGISQETEGDFHIGYKAHRPNLSNFSLDISSVKMNYSAVYFCASSVNTALQTLNHSHASCVGTREKRSASPSPLSLLLEAVESHEVAL
uniref:Uncharacterized protein n=1 Tax=Melopsittacus undulatus TaxID=13146 RepID=A0A8C6INZ0_MELUD